MSVLICERCGAFIELDENGTRHYSIVAGVILCRECREEFIDMFQDWLDNVEVEK